MRSAAAGPTLKELSDDAAPVLPYVDGAAEAELVVAGVVPVDITAPDDMVMPDADEADVVEAVDAAPIAKSPLVE